jgi:uncharacterized SAM-binding protein YcdF (DUF218 family)
MKVWKRIVTIAVVAVIVFIAADVAVVLSFAHTKRSIDHADAAIVLGAAIGSPAAYNRALEAVELVEQGKTEVVVTAGGKIANKDQSEAAYMAKAIKAKSTKSPQVILEEESHNTYENIYNAKAKIPDAKSAVIVSDEFHLARGVLLAKRAGFEEVYWASPPPDYYRKDELRWYYVREFIAMINYLPKFIFG